MFKRTTGAGYTMNDFIIKCMAGRFERIQCLCQRQAGSGLSAAPAPVPADSGRPRALQAPPAASGPARCLLITASSHGIRAPATGWSRPASQPAVTASEHRRPADHGRHHSPASERRRPADHGQQHSLQSRHQSAAGQLITATAWTSGRSCQQDSWLGRLGVGVC